MILVGFRTIPIFTFFFCFGVQVTKYLYRKTLCSKYLKSLSQYQWLNIKKVYIGSYNRVALNVMKVWVSMILIIYVRKKIKNVNTENRQTYVLWIFILQILNTKYYFVFTILWIKKTDLIIPSSLIYISSFFMHILLIITYNAILCLLHLSMDILILNSILSNKNCPFLFRGYLVNLNANIVAATNLKLPSLTRNVNLLDIFTEGVISWLKPVIFYLIVFVYDSAIKCTDRLYVFLWAPFTPFNRTLSFVLFRITVYNQIQYRPV